MSDLKSKNECVYEQRVEEQVDKGDGELNTDLCRMILPIGVNSVTPSRQQFDGLPIRVMRLSKNNKETV